MADIGINIEGTKEDTEMGESEDKKRKVPGGAAAAGSSAAAAVETRLEKMEATLSKMNVTVGEGDYAAEGHVATMRGLVVLEREVASLKHAVEESYEMVYPNPIAESMKAEKANWIEECKNAKGKGIQVGDCYHYAFLGMIKAIVQDTALDGGKRKKLWEVLLSKCASKEDPSKVDKSRLQETFDLCRTCSSKIHKEKCYLNWTPGRLLTSSVEGNLAREFIEQAILKYGKVQMNAQPAAPSYKAMKDSLIQRKEWGKGKGKGSG